jgi:putative iron-dependent peroxidase
VNASSPQSAILDPVPSLGHYLVFGLEPGTDPRPALHRLREDGPLDGTVIGIGLPLVEALGSASGHRAAVPGLRAFPALAGPAVAVPSTQGALWAFIGGAEATLLFDRAERLKALLGAGFRIDEEVASFRYREGRDLSGYLDGTANPSGAAAAEAALVASRGAGLDGGSFVAVQRWLHDLAGFARLPAGDRDAIVGRRIADNEEMPDAPSYAHVKRTEQESFDPPAFMVRRSMPWGGATERGLYFVAFGESLNRFERTLERMLGMGDGVVDGLFRFSRPMSGGYYFCPPTTAGRLDWSALGH